MVRRIETPANTSQSTHAKHDWIEIVAKPDRGHRAVGPGVIEAFYAGVETVNLNLIHTCVNWTSIWNSIGLF